MITSLTVAVLSRRAQSLQQYCTVAVGFAAIFALYWLEKHGYIMSNKHYQRDPPPMSAFGDGYETYGYDDELREALRFRVGEVVEARVPPGLYERAEVLRHWDMNDDRTMTYAYRLKLESNGKEFWAREDLDNYVREIVMPKY